LCSTLSVFAVACGGGGGGTTDTTTPPSSNEPPPTTPPPTTPPPTTPPPANLPDLGAGADMQGFLPFPATDAWNTPIDGNTADPNSDTLIASIGIAKGLHPDFGAFYNGGPFGIPYVVVAGTQPTVPMTFGYADQSDPGPYPIPPDAPIEGGAASTGDRHILAIDRDHSMLFETWSTYPRSNPAVNGWDAGSGAIFDLTKSPSRPAGWTSADAAGLPIFPGLVRYDEVVTRGAILHALRFTVANTRHAYIAPATHYASSYVGADRPPMGMRVRLKASFVTSTFPAQSRVVLDCLKRYGMIVADNGSDWFLSGAPDARWDDNDLNTLKNVKGSNFEVVQMGTIVTN
jgi:hypothetical protein